MFVFQSFSEPPRMGSQKIQNDDLSDAKNGFAQIDKTVKNYTSGRMDSLVRMINQHIDRLSAASPGLMKPQEEQMRIAIKTDANGNRFFDFDAATEKLYATFYKTISSDSGIQDRLEKSVTKVYKIKEAIGEEEFFRILHENNGNFFKFMGALEKIYQDPKQQIEIDAQGAPDKWVAADFAKSMTCLMAVASAGYASNLNSKVADINVREIAGGTFSLEIEIVGAKPILMMDVYKMAKENAKKSGQPGKAEQQSQGYGKRDFDNTFDSGKSEYAPTPQEQARAFDFLFGKGSTEAFAQLGERIFESYLEEVGIQPPPIFASSSDRSQSPAGLADRNARFFKSAEDDEDAEKERDEEIGEKYGKTA